MGASVGTLPQHLNTLLHSVSQISQPQTSEGGSTQGLSEVAELSTALSKVSEAPAGLSNEERSLLSDASPEVKVMANPLMAKILQNSAAGHPSDPGAVQQSLQTLISFQKFYDDYQTTLSGLLWASCVGLVLLAALVLVLDMKGLSRLLCGVVHSLSGRWLWAVSIGALGAFLSMKVNLWASLPSELWVAPSVGLLMSAGLLRTLDMNAPVWNGTFTSLLAPLASCGIILGWDFGSGLLRGLI